MTLSVLTAVISGFRSGLGLRKEGRSPAAGLFRNEFPFPLQKSTNYNRWRKLGKEHYCLIGIVLFLFLMPFSPIHAQIINTIPVPVLSNSVLQPPEQKKPEMPEFSEDLPTPEQLRTGLLRQMELRQPNKTLVETITPSVILRLGFAYGAETEFLCRVAGTEQARSGSKPVYAVGILCWNIPAADKTLLTSNGTNLYAKVGFNYQQTGGELLAMLASAKVTDDYEIRPDQNRSMRLADLVQTEKMLADYNGSQALRAAGLAFYLTDIQEKWTAKNGSEISLRQLAEYELRRPVLWNQRESVERLYGLSSLQDRFSAEINAGRGDAALGQTEEKLNKFFTVVRPWVRSLADPKTHLWTGDYFSPKAEKPEPMKTLITSAAVLRWLMFSASAEEAASEESRRAVWNLAILLAKTIPVQTPYSEMSPEQIDAVADSITVFSYYLQKTGYK